MQLSAPGDRVTALITALAEEPEPLVALTHLLRECRNDHVLLRERLGDQTDARRLGALLRDVVKQLPPAGTESVLGLPVRRAFVSALGRTGDLPLVLVARAIAELIDGRYSHTFAGWFQRRSPYQPSVGDPFPLDTPDLRDLMAMPATAPPWRLAQRLDETRHVRLAGEWVLQFRVAYDYSVFETLAGVVTADTVFATCHPSRDLEDYDLPAAGRRAYPVRPRDPGRQRLRIDRLIGQATAAGASVVVLPELCVTEKLALGLSEWVARPGGPRVLVAGSFHHAGSAGNGAPPRRRNTAMAWVRGHPTPLTQDKHSPADLPVIEDIQPAGWPELRIFVTADGWHLALAVCRDLLNPQAASALSEAGANLVLVPAMSETLVPFGGPVAHLVGTRQAFVLVANDPGEWSGHNPDRSIHPARALFGHPGLGQQSRLVHSSDPGPGVALMTVRSAAITWLPQEEHVTAEGRTGPSGGGSSPTAPPLWLSTLEARVHRGIGLTVTGSQPLKLRPAAVLVVVADSPCGPSVLLIERAGDLRDYPGQWTFPGGAVEPTDGGPVDAALREAHEEAGLEIRCVAVVGLLSPMALPDTAFMVYPVVSWTADRHVSRTLNRAEVSGIRWVPLQDFARRGASAPPLQPEGPEWVPARDSVSHDVGRGPAPYRVGSMTAAVLDQLVGMLASSPQGREVREVNGVGTAPAGATSPHAHTPCSAYTPPGLTGSC